MADYPNALRPTPISRGACRLKGQVAGFVLVALRLAQVVVLP